MSTARAHTLGVHTQWMKTTRVCKFDTHVGHSMYSPLHNKTQHILLWHGITHKKLHPSKNTKTSFNN